MLKQKTGEFAFLKLLRAFNITKEGKSTHEEL